MLLGNLNPELSLVGECASGTECHGGIFFQYYVSLRLIVLG